VLRDNPLTDIRATRTILTRVKRGTVLSMR